MKDNKRLSQGWRSSRTPALFFLTAALSLIVFAVLGVREINSINEENSTIRVDRAGRSAAALVAARVPNTEVIRDEQGAPISIEIDTELLEPGPMWNELLDDIGETNQGAANVFRYSSDSAAFDRLSTTFRDDEGNRVGGSTIAHGLIKAGHTAYPSVTSGKPFVGEVPVAGRLRLAYLTPLFSADGSLNGILAVDVGWVDDLQRINGETLDSTLVVTMTMLAIVTLVSALSMFRSFLPLHRLSRVAHALGTDQDIDEAALKLVDRDDEVGYLARGLTKVADLQQKLEHRAYNDLLTSIPNRAALTRELQSRLESLAKDNLSSFALLILDLDGFKQVNDGLGHQAGDELLTLVATQLRDAIEPGEFVARLGGDEFAVITANGAVDNGSLDDLTTRIGEISGTFQTSFGEAQVSTSIGIALAPDHGRTLKQVMSYADLAMYEAKRSSGESVKTYEVEMSEVLERQLYIVAELRDALIDSTISVVYQPIFDGDGHVVATEALARWNHETEGMIAPSEFIPIAEGAGLVQSLGSTVFDHACRSITEWTAVHEYVPPVSVNVSTMQLRSPDFVASVARTLEKYPAARGLLSIELTESIAVADKSGWHRPVLAQLRELGVYIAIDDFGTGYAALSYLHDLRVDMLKVDQSFVEAAIDNPANVKLLSGIVSLGKSLGLSIVIEGVETEEQLVIVREMNFDGLQGFLLAHPMQAADVAELFSKRHELLAQSALADL